MSHTCPCLYLRINVKSRLSKLTCICLITVKYLKKYFDTAKEIYLKQVMVMMMMMIFFFFNIKTKMNAQMTKQTIVIQMLCVQTPKDRMSVVVSKATKAMGKRVQVIVYFFFSSNPKTLMHA